MMRGRSKQAMTKPNESPVSVADLKRRANPENPRTIASARLSALKDSIVEFGDLGGFVLNVRSGLLCGGHQRGEAMPEEATIEIERRYDPPTEPAGTVAEGSVILRGERFKYREVDWPKKKERLAMLAANQHGGEWTDGLKTLVEGLDERDRLLAGFMQDDIASLLAPSPPPGPPNPTLRERFGVPPFSVLDARQGYWQERKRAWLALGIQSEVGRGNNLIGRSPQELFCHFTGTPYGKARKIVAEAMKAQGEAFDLAALIKAHGGRGADLKGLGALAVNKEAAEPGLNYYRRTNKEAARSAPAGLGGMFKPIAKLPSGPDSEAAIGPGGVKATSEIVTDPSALTPVETVEVPGGTVFLKRDDLFSFAGAWGAKARALIKLLAGQKGCTTAGNSRSPMVSRVARAAQALGVIARCHCAKSKHMTDQVADAKAHGAIVIEHKVAYLTALIAKAKKDAAAHGFKFIPLGVECREYIEVNAAQFANLPPAAKRYVITVGSGMALASLLAAFKLWPELRRPVVGVVVGGAQSIGKRGRVVALLDQWASGWRDECKLEVVDSEFDQPEKQFHQFGTALDPHYEAKAALYVRAGDCFVIVACRSTPFAVGGKEANDRS